LILPKIKVPKTELSIEEEIERTFIANHNSSILSFVDDSKIE
jgi:hypothetical protein